MLAHDIVDTFATHAELVCDIAGTAAHKMAPPMNDFQRAVF